MKLTYIATAGLIVLVGAGVYLVVQNENEGQKQEMQAAFDKKLQQLENKFNDQSKVAEDVQKKLKDAAEAVKPVVADVAGAVKDPSVKEALNAVKQDVLQKGGISPGAAPGSNLPAVANTVAPEPPNYAADPPNPDARARMLEDDLLKGSGVGTDRVTNETGKVTGAIPDDENAAERLNEMQGLIVAQPRIARVGDARAADNAGFVVLDEGLNKGLAKGDRFAVRRGTILVARIIVSDNIQATQCVADIVPNTLVAGMSIKNGDDVIKFDR